MDTVILKIYGPDKFQIKNTEWFLPELKSRKYSELSATEKKSNRIYLRHFVFHPPYQTGYLPKIEIFETLGKTGKDVVYILKAEFSASKLLYKNSLQEVSEGDMDKVISFFKASLLEAGIRISFDSVANARVSGIHLCKNVLLPSDMRMQEVLAELQRVDISKVFDVTQKETKNGGRILHIYSNTIDRVFYDKIADAMKPKVKRKDKGRINDERAVIEKYGLQNREVFRYEYRIKKGQTVTREINIILGREPKTSVVFKDLFSEGVFKKIIIKSWRELIQRPENQLALLGPKDDLAMLLHMLSQAKVGKKAHALNKALISYGLACTIRDHGVKETKRAIFTVINTDHSERLTNKILTSSELAKGLPYSNTVTYIDRALENFELINLTSLQNEI